MMASLLDFRVPTKLVPRYSQPSDYTLTGVYKEPQLKRTFSSWCTCLAKHLSTSSRIAIISVYKYGACHFLISERSRRHVEAYSSC